MSESRKSLLLTVCPLCGLHCRDNPNSDGTHECTVVCSAGGLKLTEQKRHFLGETQRLVLTSKLIVEKTGD